MNHANASPLANGPWSVGRNSAVASRAPPTALEIPELLVLILSLLSSSWDLVNVACTARRFSDSALRLLWENPDFPGNPLKNMVTLFPDNIKSMLLPQPDPSLRIPHHAFGRFDYYAKFVRHLQVWSFDPDARIARVLDASRPNLPLFPSLESIHLGADDNSLQMAAPFLSPSLRTVRVNHWDAGTPAVLHSDPGVTKTLLLILRLPELDQLDLLDTRLPSYETDPVVVDAFVHAASRVSMLYSLDFTTLRPVFDVLARNAKLTAVFLDLTCNGVGHYLFDDIARRVRHEFLRLDTIVMQAMDTQGIDLLQESRRALKRVDFRVHGPFEPMLLLKLTTALQPSANSLQIFRCSTSERGDHSKRTSLYDAISPLRHMPHLRKIVMSITVHAEDMLRDEHIAVLFRCWPNLTVWVLESDPEDGTPIDLDSPGSGLTLQSLLTIRRCCPSLTELSVPFVDTMVIPSLTGIPYTMSRLPLDLRLSRCHAHNRPAIKRFVEAIWPEAECSFEDCSCVQSGV
ncbi:hypothetical protein CALVIDRAFT_188700 [Calocera viscosa TUFC12733]|uniref:F-box domain-containing protein n=1 Tax=Calocera viscosa (strain TUFC12733) TaxID=1330018 RepID=A0A167KW96_CALVF|nr:hypothetical protein CALVIDRAFT_188700 [Calocera viscosa TUFC12733]